MWMIGRLISLVARCADSAGTRLHRLSHILTRRLPALLSPPDLTKLATDYYAREVYNASFISQVLNSWEGEPGNRALDVLDRYNLRSGRILVLGCGWGHECFAVASRSWTVIGVESNRVAIRTASRLAMAQPLSVSFHQADWFALPYAPKSFDCIIMPSLMYSSIPGAARRQRWLTDLRCLLKPDGFVFLSFVSAHPPGSRLARACISLNLRLARLPGANAAYQPGDDFRWGHFYHVFQDEDEIRQELTSAGALVREVDWCRGLAVIA
jgi:2-polyprenyl-3-methyl-5-hydroxy-6-metoxy-1,4-benzoquinol methylase